MLYPDTVFFLGDLFDGGREWSTTKHLKETRWGIYGQNFWLGEYERFRKIFFDPWLDSSNKMRPGQRGRKMVVGLPGNHDLGFGDGVELPIRERFNTYFGDGNRVDIIGNHTFVSIDSVSLSAWNGNEDTNKEIWKPTMDFLDEVENLVKRAQVQDILNTGDSLKIKAFEHRVLNDDDIATNVSKSLKTDVTALPSILLTHVPLFRAPDTPCGPLRERFPPSLDTTGEPLTKDARNAISISSGYQYQNVLTSDISRLITNKIKRVYFAFSGDDHDYCEIIHTDYSTVYDIIHEITVKSVSWAMGVRKPGFVMLSLYNPLNLPEKISQGERSEITSTLQSNLCLLPDQLGIFIYYGLMFVLTLIVIVARAASKTLFIMGKFGRRSRYAVVGDDLEMRSGYERKFDNPNVDAILADSYSSANSSTSTGAGRFFTHANRARARSVSLTTLSSGDSGRAEHQFYASQGNGVQASHERQVDKDTYSLSVQQRPRRPNKYLLFVYESGSGICKVASVVLCWYFFLIFRG